MLVAESVEAELKKSGSLARARVSEWFFKTGKGEYGYGDVFFGVTVPEQRTIAKHFRDLPLHEVANLLAHKAHECRLTGLFILVGRYERAAPKEKGTIARFYFAHRRRVNNWDLVDSSASYILGDYLLQKNRSKLYALARSKSIWDKRIAIIATHAFIRKMDFKDTLAIAAILLSDPHDLIHKAVGWTLREVGKRSSRTLETFLRRHASSMPRTALRYAIEKFSKRKRKAYLTMR